MIALPLWTLAVAGPVLFMLSFTTEHLRRALAWVGGYVAVLMLLSIWIGLQATPVDQFRVEELFQFSALSALAASFVALIHLQPRIRGEKPDYSATFAWSWRNFLCVGLSWLLALGVLLVLTIWEGLFSAIGIAFFDELFERKWFLLPVLAMAFAFGLHSFRSATATIDTVRSLLARLGWLLLPILLMATTLFLATLPFTGLKPLWDTDHGTAILMAANLAALFLLNVVYQTGEERPYPLLTHWILTVPAALFPILSALAMYGLGLRMGQYGLTPQRLWALLVIVLAGCFSLGYAWIIVRRREAWPGALPSVNRNLSWAVMASLLLTASPLLDFRLLSSWDYFSRIHSGEIEIADVDGQFIERQLARFGHTRLQALRESLEASDPEAAQMLRFATGEEEPFLAPEEEEAIIMRPEPFDIPQGLSREIRSWKGDEALPMPIVLFRVELGDDYSPEYVAIRGSSATNYAKAQCWTEESPQSDSWVSCGIVYLTDAKVEAELMEQLGNADFEAVTPSGAYKHLRVGDHILAFQP